MNESARRHWDIAYTRTPTCSSHFIEGWILRRISNGDKMKGITYPSVAATHAPALLKELNCQRERGQFCDCVIRLQFNPGKLYLAHRNVLAASSPVLASLLSNQGALLDLQIPGITPETLGHLLEFIYTGALPPPDLDESVHSAATYFEMEELQQALNCRQDSPSGLAVDMEADETEVILKRRFVEHQQMERNVHSPSHHHEAKWTVPLLPSCEVVPVIRHASTKGLYERLPLLSEIHCKSSNIDFGCHDIREREAGDKDQVLGIYQHGYLPKCSGLQNVERYKAALHGSESRQDKFLSAITDTNKDELVCHISNEIGHPHCETTRKIEYEEKWLKNICKTVITNAVVSSKGADGCTHSAEAITEDTEIKDQKDDIVANRSGEFVCHESTHVKSSIGGTDESEKDFESIDGHYDFEKEHSSLVNQFDADSKTRDTIHPTVVHMVCSHTNVVNVETPPNTNADSLEERKGNLFAESAIEGHMETSNTWKLEANRDDCAQVNEPKSLRKTIIIDSDLWNETSNFCAENTALSGEDKMTEASTESMFSFQSSNNVMIHNADHQEKEKWDFISNSGNDSQTYQGKVTYHCFLREGQVVETSDCEDVCSSFSDTDITGGSTLHKKSSLSSPLQVDVSDPLVPIGYGGSTEVARNFSGSTEASAADPAALHPYQCKMCDRAFSQRGSLNRHMRSHLGVRPYACPHCPMTFSRQYRVTEHMRVHQRSFEGLQRTGPA